MCQILDLLPPLKVPRIAKINREMFINMRKRANCKRISETIQSTMATLHFYVDHHEYPNSRISTISSLKLDSASKRNPQCENYGLYALKCDRSRASQHGIILPLPPFFVGICKKTRDPKAMIHEKFEPCQKGIELVDENTGENTEEVQRNVNPEWVKKDTAETRTAVVAPPRRKRQVKRSQKTKLSQLKLMASPPATINAERKDIGGKLPSVEIESTQARVEVNLMENRLKIARSHRQREDVDIFKKNHSRAFDEFDSIFDSVPRRDEKAMNIDSPQPPTRHSNAKYDTKVKLKEDEMHKSNKETTNTKIEEHLEKSKVPQGYPVPNINVEQWQMSNHVPECKISRSNNGGISRIERIQFHNEFIPNSFSLKHSPISDHSIVSETSNSIDYYVIKSSERKVTLPLAPRVGGEGKFEHFDDENTQIWTI